MDQKTEALYLINGDKFLHGRAISILSVPKCCRA